MRSGELFAGVGGLGMAVDEVFGAQPAWFAEFDTAPSKVLAHRHPDIPNYGDVTAVDWKTTPDVNILAGGFPCQDVSLAGRRRGMTDGTRSGLWSEYAKAIDEIRPEWVVIENVRGLLSADAASDMEPCPLCVGDNPGHVLRALGAVLGDLAELGFDAEWTGIRASDIGAPHGRFRVFILAWPAANTDRDGLGVIGRVEAVESDTYRRDGTDEARHDSELTTRVPVRTRESRAGDGAGWGTPDLALLPTPGAYDGERGGSQHPDKRREGNHSVTIQDVAEHLTLMPTPRASRGGSATETMYQLGAVRVDDERAQGQVVLLPTPTVGNATGGNAQRGGDRSDEKLLPGLARDHATDWGPYADAIARWESVISRPAPTPVRMDGKGGRARLNPELTEWMMGWPAGHVTDPAIGLSRAEQLKACGNGVVPQQAAAALRELLSRPGVPSIRKEVAA